MTTFTIESLAKQPGRDMFDCGEPDLDEWLHRYARQSDARNETLTRVALHPDDGRIVGYYALKSYHLVGAELEWAFGPRVRYPVPCILLARLARCQSVIGQGVGELLLAHALRTSARVSEEIGVQVVVVHAIGERAAAFYRRYGFTPFVDHPNHLLLPVKSVRRTFGG